MIYWPILHSAEYQNRFCRTFTGYPSSWWGNIGLLETTNRLVRPSVMSCPTLSMVREAIHKPFSSSVMTESIMGSNLTLPRPIWVIVGDRVYWARHRANWTICINIWWPTSLSLTSAYSLWPYRYDLARKLGYQPTLQSHHRFCGNQFGAANDDCEWTIGSHWGGTNLNRYLFSFFGITPESIASSCRVTSDD